MFICPYCQKAFNEKGNLKIHIRIHTNERPYICNICQKAFKTVGHLKEHKFSHTGLKPFQCPLCKKFYRRKGILKEHIKFHFKGENKLLSVNPINITHILNNLRNFEILEKFKKMKLNLNMPTLKGLIDEQSFQTLNELAELQKALIDADKPESTINYNEIENYLKENIKTNIKMTEAQIEEKISEQNAKSLNEKLKKASSDYSSVTEIEQSVKNSENSDFNEKKNDKESLIFYPDIENIKEYLRQYNESDHLIFSDKMKNDEISNENFRPALLNNNLFGVEDAIKEKPDVNNLNNVSNLLIYGNNNCNINNYFHNSLRNDEYEQEYLNNSIYHF